DVVDVLHRVAAVDERFSHTERRHHVARRAAAGDHRECPVVDLAHRAVRAQPKSRPAAVIDTSSEVPPNDRNGRVRRVTGSMPVTPPMLMIACTAIHAVMPPARSWLKRSAARNDVLTPR